MDRYKEILKKNNQEHLLAYIEKASKEQKNALIKQIEEIDFDELSKLYEISTQSKNKAVEGMIIEHIRFTDKYGIPKEKYEALKEIGNNIIKSGKYAAVTMAGGQGTRLGHTGPKGTFWLNVKGGPKFLFQILAESLEKSNKEFNVTVPWYIMTSTANNDETVKFFEEHDYFGYGKENVKFFKQNDLPILDENGKLMVEEDYSIKVAADGNGCIYRAMKEQGVIDDMKKKGIEWVFVGNVDNAILDMCDPILVGLTVSEGNEIGCKSIVKREPHEKVGAFCKKNGKPGVIEYTELPDEMAEERDEDGELLFGEASINHNLYKVSAIEKIADKKLPYHSAYKKQNYLGIDGKLVSATEPNSYKYEAYIFDGFGFFDNMSILRGRREEDFAPVKNRVGEDSPDTAIALYNAKYNL